MAYRTLYDPRRFVRDDSTDATYFTPPTDVAYAAGNFTSSAGTWVVDAGDQKAFWYLAIGSGAMLIVFDIHVSTITGAPVELYLPIPAGFVATERSDAPLGLYIENNVPNTGGSVKVDPGVSATRLAIYRPDGVAFAAGANNCYFAGQIWVR